MIKEIGAKHRHDFGPEAVVTWGKQSKVGGGTLILNAGVERAEVVIYGGETGGGFLKDLECSLKSGLGGKSNAGEVSGRN